LTGTDATLLSARLEELLRLEQVTAVIASSTPLAIIALDAMTAVGRRTPDDLAFATFDGFDQHPMFTPSLTTIRQPAVEIGETAVRLLQERMAGADLPPRIERLEATLELRDSTEAYRPSA